MRGAIGAPLNDRESDVDYYRVPGGKGRARCTRGWKASPASTWCSSCSTRRAAASRRATRTGVGWVNGCSRRPSDPTEAYLAVREVWIDGTKPTANAPDPYTLTARWGPPQPDWEIEPNDWPAAATPLVPANAMRGYLGSADDRDWFSITADRRRRW